MGQVEPRPRLEGGHRTSGAPAWTRAWTALGFHLVGYGCTTCIGASGPLPSPISRAVGEGELAVCAVLSGNRSFEARIHPDVRANYLASPPLVVAYALAGSIDVDLVNEPLRRGRERRGRIPARRVAAREEVDRTIAATLPRGLRGRVHTRRALGGLETPAGDLFAWEPGSTYVRRPPHFDGMGRRPEPVEDVVGARCLVLLGDFVTTDHISPAGAIRADSLAGRHLRERGVGDATSTPTPPAGATTR